MERIRSQQGAALVEFAIVLPMLLLLVFGMIEFSLLLYNKAVITNASREAARAGIVFKVPPEENPDAWKTQQETSIKEIASSYCADYLITLGGGSGGEPLDVQLASALCVDGSAGDDLVVDISYKYSFLVFPKIVAGLFSGDGTGELTLNARTIMRCE